MLAGGGTGGHVFPLVAIAEQIQNLFSPEGDKAEIEFIGESQLMKSEAVNLGIKFRSILAPKWRRYFSFRNFIDILKCPLGFLQAIFYVWFFMPDLVFIKGGYGSFLPAVVAKLFFIPIVVHESDAIPGRTNRFFGRWAKKVYIGFDAASQYFKPSLTEVVGNPIRSVILNITDVSIARSAFSLKPSKPTVLITGASQGAKKINENLMLALVELIRKFQIIHQTGQDKFTEINDQLVEIIKEGAKSYGQEVSENYRIYPMLDASKMALAYSACDVVVSRAGSAVFEIAAVGKPVVLIPLKHAASNHQLANAQQLEKFGAIVVQEDNLSPHLLIREIDLAFENRIALGQKMSQFAKPDAARNIATGLLALV